MRDIPGIEEGAKLLQFVLTELAFIIDYCAMLAFCVATVSVDALEIASIRIVVSILRAIAVFTEASESELVSATLFLAPFTNVW